MSIQKLEVRYTCSPFNEATIGTLLKQKGKIYFQYADSFLEDFHWLSPFKLPKQKGLIEHTDWQFGELFGLFDDSLPDGWGLLLMDRYFRKHGIQPKSLSILDRLAYLGSRTMGALTYHPSSSSTDEEKQLFDLFAISKNAEELIQGEDSDVLEELLLLGGSPGGARPKVLVAIKDQHIIGNIEKVPKGYQPWLLKFHSKKDDKEEGLIEEIYAQMARRSGLEMPSTRLFFEPRQEKYFFGIERFDRVENQRIHCHSFGNLIHSNFRIPSCDYSQLLQVARVLTKQQNAVEKIFRQMIFNILTHNRDDHVKNFAFCYNYETRTWAYTPSYDLTFSHGPGGEHSMTINGEGRNPTWNDCLQLASMHNISVNRALEIKENVQEGVSNWQCLARDLGVSSGRINELETSRVHL